MKQIPKRASKTSVSNKSLSQNLLNAPRIYKNSDQDDLILIGSLFTQEKSKFSSSLKNINAINLLSFASIDK